jgi:anti-sigma regulatory factor (Ser/Thr protein kinase)
VDLPVKQLFRAHRADFGAIRNFMESACTILPHADRQRLVLIVEELFCNSVEHGYGGDCDRPVWLSVTPGSEGCHLVYTDAAPAYDPFAAPKDPLLGADVESRPVGGLGIYLIGEICTAKRYERRDEHNVIELFVPRLPPGDRS